MPGWDGDAARVYALLDFDYGGSITLEEIDAKAHSCLLDPFRQLSKILEGSFSALSAPMFAYKNMQIYNICALLRSSTLNF